MNLQPLEHLQFILEVLFGVIGFTTVITMLARLSKCQNLDSFPTVGSGTWLGSWFDGFKYLIYAQSIVQEGYEKYKPTPFKVAGLYHWTIILCNETCIEELAAAPEDKLSILEAMNDLYQFNYTVTHGDLKSLHHLTVGAIRSHLTTRNIASLNSDLKDEISLTFDEVLDLRGNEWKSIPALRTMEKVICRTSNRLFVGLPLCRDPDWIDLNIHYAVDSIKGGAIIGLFPKFMRPLATHFISRVPQSVRRGMKFLRPIVEERQKYLNMYGTEWDDKPNDLLCWLMEAEGPGVTIETLTNSLLLANLAAIHASSNSFTQALFYLAANTQYIQPLRKEVEDIVEYEGWSSTALDKMRKVESFLKECQRIEGMSIASLSRKALKDFTFSDGTFVPKGTTVSVPTYRRHHDGDIYENPDVFQPFRFSGGLDSGEDRKHSKLQLTSTTTKYLGFGHGRHACPGRFFAASELKAMLAHLVVTYDIKLEDNATHPPSMHLGDFIISNLHAKVMFRKRVE